MNRLIAFSMSRVRYMVDHAFQFQPEVEEAERDAREALKEAKDDAHDGDVLAILLQAGRFGSASLPRVLADIFVLDFK